MTLSAVLLAGGESRRMGQDKATLRFEGEPLWKRQLKLLRQIASGQLFVSARTRPSWLPDDAELVLDDSPSRGPLSGLTKALASMRTTHLIALAVDMPFMTGEQMIKLRELAEAGRGVVPVIGDHVEPLAAIYPAEAMGDFATALVGLDLSLQRVVRRVEVAGKVRLVLISDEDAPLFRSVNAPADLSEFNA